MKGCRLMKYHRVFHLTVAEGWLTVADPTDDGVLIETVLIGSVWVTFQAMMCRKRECVLDTYLTKGLAKKGHMRWVKKCSRIDCE
jgi:hypothetical protein